MASPANPSDKTPRADLDCAKWPSWECTDPSRRQKYSVQSAEMRQFSQSGSGAAHLVQAFRDSGPPGLETSAECQSQSPEWFHPVGSCWLTNPHSQLLLEMGQQPTPSNHPLNRRIFLSPSCSVASIDIPSLSPDSDPAVIPQSSEPTPPFLTASARAPRAGPHRSLRHGRIQYPIQGHHLSAHPP